MQIIVTWKEGKACAEVPGLPEVRGTGRSEREAIGDLVATHHDRLVLPVQIDGLS
jgi:hypothetical protein